MSLFSECPASKSAASVSLLVSGSPCPGGKSSTIPLLGVNTDPFSDDTEEMDTLVTLSLDGINMILVCRRFVSSLTVGEERARLRVTVRFSGVKVSGSCCGKVSEEVKL